MSDSTARYHWIVTRDSIVGDSSDAIGKVGPSGTSSRPRFADLIIRGTHFRLLNDQGKVQFTGYILGDFEGHEPLVDYGVDNGCSQIEYERDGSWVPHKVEKSE